MTGPRPRPGRAARGLALLVRGYQVAFSSWLPPRCRFAPSCSSYAREALLVHGAWRGSWLALRRVARCHPFHPGGHDPVPPGPAATGARAPGLLDRPARPGIGDDGGAPCRPGRSSRAG